MTKLLTISFDSANREFCVEINRDEVHAKELIALGLNSLYKELPDILPSSLALALYISDDPDYLAGILNYRVHRIISTLEGFPYNKSKMRLQNQ
jgi:hypothetical protein